MAELNETQIDEMAGRLVGEDVRVCLSSLVYACSQNYEAALALGLSEEDIYTLASRRATPDDYRDHIPAGARGFRLEVTDSADGWDWAAFDRDDGEKMEASAEPFDSEVDAYRDAFDRLGWDEPDGSECFEHWAVSDYLAEKLEAKGESVVRDFLGLTVWGRCTSGQMIRMDHVIREIARDTLNFTVGD